MPKAPVYDLEGNLVEEVELPDRVFGLRPNLHLLWEAVRMHLFRRRQGTHKAKTRGEIRGSRRKIWSQKHTGRARHGDRYAPIFVGGGKAHGPRPKDWNYSIPKKAQRKALAMALSDRARERRILIISEPLRPNPPKTKRVAELLSRLKLGDAKVVLAPSEYSRELYLSGRNIPKVQVVEAAKLNTYQVLWSDYLVLERGALDVLVGRLSS